MIFKCKNCGGNSVYNPDKGTMYCPHCESLDSEEKIPSTVMTECVNCGAPLEIGDFTSASKCPHCGSYIIFEERVQGEFTPSLILPFKISKQKAVDLLHNEFRKRTFTPSGFLSSASIDKMEGTYVPFFMYDYDADVDFQGKGTKVRAWTSGDTEYTETSFYDVIRKMDIDFQKIPVDASKCMEDNVMDLMEPYDYKALENFKEKYLSGFLGEKYNFTSAELEERAKQKADKDARMLLQDSLTGYTTLTREHELINLKEKEIHYTLLPVWVYLFSYQGKEYQFHINGQSGKIIGVTPVAKQKVIGYSATVFGIIMVIGLMLRMILEVL